LNTLLGNAPPNASPEEAGTQKLTNRVAAIPRLSPSPALLGPDDPAWRGAVSLAVDQFRPEGSDHRPRTTLQLLHDGEAIHGLFRVEDRYVRCVHDTYGAPVYQDSCVEFFLQPKPGRGYFNFEFNCGGAFLCNHITDETRFQGAFKAFTQLSTEDVRSVRVATSRPGLTEPEIAGPVAWWLAFRIPVAVVEKFVGPVSALAGQVWRGNAYKCGNDTSHPHWAAWAPVDALNFHLPRCFGELRFASVEEAPGAD